jgi:hypothetical protein
MVCLAGLRGHSAARASGDQSEALGFGETVHGAWASAPVPSQGAQ